VNVLRAGTTSGPSTGQVYHKELRLARLRSAALEHSQASHSSARFQASKACGFDRSGNVYARSEGHRNWHEVFHITGPNLPINGVHTGNIDSDENFASACLRPRRVFEFEFFRSTVLMNAHCFHVGSQSPVPLVLPMPLLSLDRYLGRRPSPGRPDTHRIRPPLPNSSGSAIT